MADNTTTAAMSGGDTIATDDIGSGVAAGAKVQRMKNGFGADGSYSDVAPDNGLPVVGGYRELTGSASANNTDLISTDVSAYRWASVHVTGTFSATVQFQVSNDGTNWLASNSFYDINLNNPSRGNSAGITNKLLVGNLNARYFRIRTIAYTSGTVTVVVELSAQPGNHGSVNVETQTNTLLVAGAASPADAASNPGGLANTQAFPAVYNGSTWDRPRTANSASGGAGLGVPAAGNLGYDGTNWQRLKADSAGVQQVNQAGAGTSAVTSVTAATSSTSLLAANTSRKQATFYNDSTANLYLKLGATASTTSFTVKVAAGGYYELPRSGYTGAIDGIWDAVNGAVRITELT